MVGYFSMQKKKNTFLKSFLSKKIIIAVVRFWKRMVHKYDADIRRNKATLILAFFISYADRGKFQWLIIKITDS